MRAVTYFGLGMGLTLLVFLVYTLFSIGQVWLTVLPLLLFGTLLYVLIQLFRGVYTAD